MKSSAKMPNEKRQLFPCFIAVDEVPPLVIGNVALLEAKIRLLLKFAPLVDLITDLRPASRLGGDDRIRVFGDVPCRQAHDLIIGRPLVILDTGDAALNASLSATARKAGVPVNVPDNTALCSAYLGSIVDRSPVLIAISTAGAAPVLGQRIRARIESMLPTGFGRIASYLETRRADLRVLSPARRRAVQHRIVDGPAADHIISGDEDAADRQLARLVVAPGDGEAAQVKIVDIGRGDPGLLSLRGVETIRNADIIVHQAGTSPAIIDLSRREVSLVTVPSGRVGSQTPETDLAGDLAGDLASAKADTQIVLLLPMRPSPGMTALVTQLSVTGRADTVIPAAMPAGPDAVDPHVIRSLTTRRTASPVGGPFMTDAPDRTGLMFTANRLDDGVVIWLTDALCWSETATEAAVFSDVGAAAARDEVVAAGDRNHIVAAYEVAADGRADKSMRERIRAGGGPTIIPPQDILARGQLSVKGDG